MDDLEDLMIIDSLLKNYDRRALPTNRMGKRSTNQLEMLGVHVLEKNN